MPSTISQLDLGTELYVRENGVPVPYVVLKKDIVGTVILRGLCSENKRMNPTNTAVYTDSEMDAYLSDETNGFMSRFDANTKSAIVTRSIPTYTFGDTECHYISRKCYLLSQGDMFGGSASALEPETSQAPVLALWKKVNSLDTARVATSDAAPTSSVGWWLRSPYSASYFYFVNNGGNSHGSVASFSNGVRPALNVSNDTIVTVGDDNKIYLTPDLAETRSVEFKVKVTEESMRPNKAKITFTAENLSNISVKVCNNYGDTNPIWVEATNGEQVTLNNATKETDKWQVGIWFYGETVSSGYVEEPEIYYTLEG